MNTHFFNGLSKNLFNDGSRVVLFSFFVNLFAAGQFFAMLLMAAEIKTLPFFEDTFVLSVLLLTVLQTGRFLSSTSAISIFRSRISAGLSISVLCISLALAGLIITEAFELPSIIIVSALLCGFGHSLSNIELRSRATSNSSKIPINNFTVFSHTGWLAGVLIVGMFSYLLSFLAVMSSLFLLSLFLLSAILFTNEKRKIDHTEPDITESGGEPLRKGKERLIILWIFSGALINSSLVTIFNASIVPYIKKNLSLNNPELSLVLSPAFLAGLILLHPSVKKFCYSFSQKYFWQFILWSRLILTTVLLTTTGLFTTLLTLPLFGLLMSSGLICQLNLIRELSGNNYRKITHSLCEIAMVAGAAFITTLSAFDISHINLLYILCPFLLIWMLFSFSFDLIQKSRVKPAEAVDI